jgi:hypothetical protein
MKHIFGVACLAALTAACHSKPKPVGKTLTQPSAKQSALPTAPITSAGLLLGAPGPAPPGSSATRAERESAVLRLFSDASLAARAPLVDLEPGREFDWELRDRLAPRFARAVPSVRVGKTIVDGPLEELVVLRILRQNYGYFRNCYSEGLARSSQLEGNVIVKLVIGLDGGVRSSADAGSNLPDSKVVKCVTAAVRGVSFPAPPRPVTVHYELKLSPG